ncbi:rhodanese-like domain-containing protein [Candidatus Woesearchaeota archaeon]|nr:rhodanese-like domain-containing protein [Candidatus Woesearchaeota archaeon]
MARIKFISIEQLLEMMENKDKFKLVEVLREEKYKEGHIPGAINIPVDELSEAAKEQLKKTDTIVVYCASYHCNASTNAAKMLLEMGYRNVLDFKGSKKAWVDAGLELEK